MEDDRSAIEQLAAILELPPDDPRRLELERSPRGRALLRTYRAFLAPGRAPAEADLENARASLHAMLDRELGLGAAPSTASRSEAATPAGPRPEVVGPAPAHAAARAPRRSWWWMPAPRLAFAMAALAVAVAGVWYVSRPPGPAAPELRGHRVEGTGAPTVALTLHPARTLAGGAVELSWEPVAGADRYQVAFFATDLTDLAHPAPTTEPRLVLAPGALPAGLSRASSVLWQVTARRGSEPLAVSETAPLRLP